jgi:RecQ-mediated genome instability protein 1
MPPPVEITRWLEEHYPKPTVAPEWLTECYNWIIGTHSLSIENDLALILEHVEMQLLNSDLRDSTLPGTGLPADVSAWQKNHLRGPGVLVEVVALTEIGHSAFNLMQVRERRIETEAVVGLDDDAEGEEGGRLPKYPRGMLRLELTDGTITLPAIEYSSLSELELGVTPLGYKVHLLSAHSSDFSLIMSQMVLNGTFIRGGTALLEPKTAIMKGGRSEDRDQQRDTDFLGGLRVRLGSVFLPPSMHAFMTEI